MPPHDLKNDRSLERFIVAQNQAQAGYESALEELRTTGKRSHWIWYIFPQLGGMGSSMNAKTYALHDLAEAVEYMRDPILGVRLLNISTVVAEKCRVGVPLTTQMGSFIDIQKLVSSLTLFGGLAGHLRRSEGDERFGRMSQIAEEILTAAKTEGFPPCRFTLDRLATFRPSSSTPGRTVH